MKTLILFLLATLLVSCTSEKEVVKDTENPINNSWTLETGSWDKISDTPVMSEKKIYTSKKGKQVTVNEKVEWTKISSPLTLTGKIPTYWVFEAVFWVGLYTSSWETIKQYYGTANIWDENQEVILPEVDFVVDFEFDASQYEWVSWYIELRNDNPSGLPEHEDNIHIPVTF